MKRNALTLIELMIVMAIIGLLFQMLLPAVEMAREAARRASCANNLRQLGIGVMMHEEAQGYYPSGGWGIFWVGDPDRGTGKDQPGSWGYNILSYVEYDHLRQRGAGLTGGIRMQAISELCMTPIPLFYCPSRRLPRAYARAGPIGLMTLNGTEPLLIDRAARADYAINTGDNHVKGAESRGDAVPKSYAQVEDTNYQWFDTSIFNGISYGRSEVKVSQLTDGLSKTYMVGEKYLPMPYYKTGRHAGDNESMYSGFDNDNCRSGKESPWQDASEFETRKPDSVHANSFGSAHPGVWQVVMCDGAVHGLSYEIDLKVHQRLANRQDGQAVHIGE